MACQPSTAPAGRDQPDQDQLPVAAFQDLVDKVLDILGPGQGERVLDVGAGSGYLCRLLQERGYAPEACDLDPTRFLARDIPFTPADLNQGLPQADDTFDLTVSLEVVEHLPNHARFFEEIIRVTKPGGRIIVTTPNILNLASRWNFFVHGYNQAAPYPIDPNLADVSMEHINPIALPQVLFYAEHYGAELVQLACNRRKKGATAAAVLLYPLLWGGLRLKLLQKKHARRHELHRRHLGWMLSMDSLAGRFIIAVLQKKRA